MQTINLGTRAIHYDIWSADDALRRLGKVSTVPEIVVLRDASTEPVDEVDIARFADSRDDAWTAGFRGDDEPDLLRYAEPLQIYRRIPDPTVDGAVTWRLDPGATFLRGSTLAALGGVEDGFDSLAGALREMALRWLAGGAIMRQRPAVFAKGSSPAVTLADRYRVLFLRRSAFWVRYALTRRLARLGSPVKEMSAFRKALAGGRRRIAQKELPLRELKQVLLPPARVTIVLPTFGRYRYVAEVLEDIRAQTVRPHQILIADGNAPEDRQPEVYERFADLPIEVLWIEQPGICFPRNQCLERATGNYIWFVDDDSRFEADNLESHLRVMEAYGADVSVGPAYTRGRPDLHHDQSFVRCTWMDCGTTLVRQQLIARVGGFDLQFNDRLLGEDGELGIRFIRSGALLVSNPQAKRFHYVAPVGGSRTSSHNIHLWRRLSRHPRPNQSIYYTGVRHFELAAALEAVTHMWAVVGWRRPEGTSPTTAWKVKTLAAEVLAFPVSLARLGRSIAMGRRMAKQGPIIPAIRVNEETIR